MNGDNSFGNQKRHCPCLKKKHNRIHYVEPKHVIISDISHPRDVIRFLKKMNKGFKLPPEIITLQVKEMKNTQKSYLC